MIRDYIRKVIPDVENRNPNGTLQGTIKAKVAQAIVDWQAPSTEPLDGTFRAAIRYEVNLYMCRLSEDERVERKKKILKNSRDQVSIVTKNKKVAKSDKKTSGTVRVLTTGNPATGQIEDTTIISFVSKYDLVVNEYWPYTYNSTTGIYTVYPIKKGHTIPTPGRIVPTDALSQQFGFEFFNQDPDINSADGGISTDILKADFVNKNAIDALCYRFDDTSACYIKDKKYIEFDDKKITKTIDLTSHFENDTVLKKLYITIGKFLVIEDTVCVLIFTSYRYKSTDDTASSYTYDTRNENYKNYSYRGSQTSIKGELLFIDRKTDTVCKKSVKSIEVKHQIRFSGIVDMIIDADTGKLIIAELSESAHTVSMPYDTVKTYISSEERAKWQAGADVNDPDYCPVTNRTCYDHHRYLNLESVKYYTKYNDVVDADFKYHLIKVGTKNWDLNFPKLDVSLYTIANTSTDPEKITLELTNKKTLFKDDGTTITTKYNYTCYGGYINCILYQDEFDQNTLYIARGYDAWIQIPITESDTLIKSRVDGIYNFRIPGDYENCIAPGDIGAFTGTEFFKITKEKAVSFKDIPGDSGFVRTAMVDDTPGTLGFFSGYTFSTHTVLRALEKYKDTDLTNWARGNSIHHIFNGGVGNTSWGTYYQWAPSWSIGLNVYMTRFIIIQNKSDDTEVGIVFGGSLEIMRTTISYKHNYNPIATTRPYYGHEVSELDDRASSGTCVSTEKNGAGLDLVVRGSNFYNLIDRSRHDVWHEYKTYVLLYQISFFPATLNIVKLNKYAYYSTLCVLSRQFDLFEDPIDRRNYFPSGLINWLTDGSIVQWDKKWTGFIGIMTDIKLTKEVNGKLEYRFDYLQLGNKTAINNLQYI